MSLMSSLYALGNDKTTVKMIETNKQALDDIKSVLDFEPKRYISNAIAFDGFYKPDENESLKIDGFELTNTIHNVINKSVNVDPLEVKGNEEFDLRAIFLILDSDDKNKRLVFQRTHKKQLLVGGSLRIVWSKNTLISTKKPGLVVDGRVDAYYENSTLYFKSYYWANQIFDLSGYYRAATDDDIKQFCDNPCFKVDDVDFILNRSDNWTRKKIAYIQDSGILDNNPIDSIIERARNLGLQFIIKNKKILFPKESKVQKELLSFLADEIYQGYFSHDVYVTNSKRSLK